MAPSSPCNEVRLPTGDGMGEQWSSVGRFDSGGSSQFPDCRPPEGLCFEAEVMGLKGDQAMSGSDSSDFPQASLTRKSKLRVNFSVDVALDGDVHRSFQLRSRRSGIDAEWVVLGGRSSSSGSSCEFGGSSSESGSGSSSSRRRSWHPRRRGFKAAARERDIKVMHAAIRQHKHSEAVMEKQQAMADDLTSKMSRLNIKTDGSDKDEDYNMLSPDGQVKTIDRMDMD